MERACLLLQTTYVTVEEIGRSSGLESPTTFRRVFFKHTATPVSARLSASMIWLSVNRDFFISVDPFLWKKFYFSAL